MTTKTTYIACDGSTFDDQSRCEAYEAELERLNVERVAEKYVHDHAVDSNCDYLVRYDGLDDCWWAGYIVRLDNEMVKHLSVLCDNPIIISNKLALVVYSEDGSYYVYDLKQYINDIKKNLKPFEELLRKEK